MWVWVIGGFVGYVASRFVNVKIESGLMRGKPYRIFFAFYKPHALGSGELIPRVVYTVQVDDAMYGTVSPFTVGSYATRADAVYAADAYALDGTISNLGRI